MELNIMKKKKPYTGTQVRKVMLQEAGRQFDDANTILKTFKGRVEPSAELVKMGFTNYHGAKQAVEVQRLNQIAEARASECTRWMNAGYMYLERYSALRFFDTLNWVIAPVDQFIGVIPRFHQEKIVDFSGRILNFHSTKLRIAAPKKLLDSHQGSGLLRQLWTVYKIHQLQKAREAYATINNAIQGLQDAAARKIDAVIDPAVLYDLQYGYIIITAWGE